ncbi:MAG: hypothetical protein H6Q73_212 [Firmicutes bacterium]|nr:hypothetical protein [Bacillota bacterium]
MNIIDNHRLLPTAFAILYVVAWLANQLGYTQLDLEKLWALGVYVLGKYGADSLWNTPKGSM